MTDPIINKVLKGIFSVPSIFVHTVWFFIWFALQLNVNLLTNIVSLEAIYIGIFVGIQQITHHEVVKKQIKEKDNDISTVQS